MEIAGYDYTDPDSGETRRILFGDASVGYGNVHYSFLLKGTYGQNEKYIYVTNIGPYDSQGAYFVDVEFTTEESGYMYYDIVSWGDTVENCTVTPVDGIESGNPSEDNFTVTIDDVSTSFAIYVTEEK